MKTLKSFFTASNAAALSTVQTSEQMILLFVVWYASKWVSKSKSKVEK